MGWISKTLTSRNGNGRYAAAAIPVGFLVAMEAKNNNDATIVCRSPFCRGTRFCSGYLRTYSFRYGHYVPVWRFALPDRNNKINAEYVKHYTNASLLVRDDFAFEDGLFSGYDAEKRQYDKSGTISSMKTAMRNAMEH